MNYHSTYKGCNIYYKTDSGYTLKWTAYCNNQFVSGDTLSGIKKLISSLLNK